GGTGQAHSQRPARAAAAILTQCGRVGALMSPRPRPNGNSYHRGLGATSSEEDVMRGLPMIVLALLAAAPAAAGEIEVGSTVDAVTVYPDGATVTRLIRVDLPRGDSTLIDRNFPPGLDPTSLRVEGETSTRVVIGAIDARAPRPDRPTDAPEIEKRIEALRDQRAALDDTIAAQLARKAFAQRFAEQAPLAGREKGDVRPLAEWREAFSAVAAEISAADSAIRESKLKQRDIDRELARLNARIQAN